MRGTDQTVRYFECSLDVGDVVSATNAKRQLNAELPTSDSALVKELNEQLREYEQIESQHGSGALLDLSRSTVASLVASGHIEKTRVDAAQAYRATLAT
ncbi:hypothetical protein AMK01_CH03332 [Rhizobium sp. N6212]|nr:hypothetical protein AMK01_CH03332 [Rhizobium sp. N6212]ANK98800.1 hypothetical protein AMK00_CH03336 [Rhizobium sp. N621]ANL04928.1 hypothetical protein AMJ99_CH03412 [Rhizobium esperanzae]ANL10987.1 hypothetical protein AMJ98_CH03363 [Rhizobium sp. N1341]ANL23039.1 hypothetical protein AMJ96_CH03363 [Rhizobium sp. N113]ANM35770.1 hypothetical protein AMK04_CH03417 [Rhizobium sp. N871]ANM41831.1 hypothetical protein AMK03_CH03366 [Rhizobium sp. N741]